MNNQYNYDKSYLAHKIDTAEIEGRTDKELNAVLYLFALIIILIVAKIAHII